MKKGRLTLALLTLMISVMPLSVIADPDITAVKSATDSTDGTNKNQETEDSTATSSESSTETETEPSNKADQNEETEASSSESESSSQEQTSSSADDTAVTSKTDNTSESEQSENTSTSTSESAEVTKSDVAEVKAGSEAEVKTTEQLKQALGNTNIKLIKLVDNLNLERENFPANHTVTIDGQGKYTITYGTPGGTGMSVSNGISFGQNNMTITVKNLNFGFPNVTGNAAKTNANNWYGAITAGDTSRNNCTVIAENINFYSNYGSKLFELRDTTNQVILRGTNTIVTQAPYNNYGQEVFKTSNLTIESGTTTIRSSSRDEGGVIWGTNGPVNMTVGAGATLDIEAAEDLIWCNIVGSSINLNDNATLKYKQVAYAQKVDRIKGYINGKSRSVTINSGENSTLDISTLNASNHPVTANLGEDSTSSFGASQADSVFSGNSVNFNLNNINQLDFNTSSKDNTKAKERTTGAIGGTSKVNGSINFKWNPKDIANYGIYINGNIKDPLFVQDRAKTWTLDGGISIKDLSAYTSVNKTKLQESNQIVIKKNAVGSLEFLSVPNTLEWTNRTIPTPNTILNRDDSNGMAIKVKDTRYEKSNWAVTATVVKENDDFKDFSLVWRDKSGNQRDLNGQTGQTVLTNKSVTPDNNVYSCSWDNEHGVLLKSEDYLSIGNYSNKLKIQWTLSDTGNAD